MKYLQLFILLIPINFLATNSSAQNPWCGIESHTHVTDHTLNNPQFEVYYQNRLNDQTHSNKKANKYIIPVVFHIIHQGGVENIDDSEIIGLVEQINQDFSLNNRDTNLIQAPFKSQAVDCQIEFRLAKIDEEGNCTNGITRTFSAKTEDVRDFGGNNVKNLIRWNQDMYLNIWVVKSILSSGEGITLGYAYYPGQGGSNDGIVMRYDQMNGNTLTHEIGHYLNLKHTFDGGCFRGDDVADTPPASEANFGCPKGRNSCTNDSPDLIDQIENYMDYSDCSAMFTNGQKIRMHSAIDFYRSELVSEDNLEDTGVEGEDVVTKPNANFDADLRIACAGEEIQFIYTGCDHSGSGQLAWNFSGPVELSSSDANPTVTFNEPGVYDVSLTVTNTKGSNKKTSDAFITIIDSDNKYSSSFLNDFNAGVPADYTLKGLPEEFGWQWSDKGRNGTSCLFVPNFGSGRPSYQASFVTPMFNILGLENQTLTYDVSYARIDEESNDLLNIHVSLDCGQTWRLVSSETAKRLETTFERAYAYVPTEDAHWLNKEIDLSRYVKYDLLVKFEFTSKNGNNLYIDNINVGNVQLGFENKNIQSAFEIFPNPSEVLGMISISAEKAFENGLITISDISGREIQKLKLQGNSLTFETKAFDRGLYFVTIEKDGFIATKRLIIE
ncbi:MAG: T9SS type A sorting domain-containing protein [Bacteroidia bacterium]